MTDTQQEYPYVLNVKSTVASVISEGNAVLRHDKATILGVLISLVPFLVGCILGLILGQVVKLK